VVNIFIVLFILFYFFTLREESSKQIRLLLVERIEFDVQLACYSSCCTYKV